MHWAPAPQKRDQMVLFSCRLDDALAADHSVRLLDDILGWLDWSTWEGCHHGEIGQPPIHPRVLAGTILYGLLTRIRSSRALEEALLVRIDFQWLLEGRTIDHSIPDLFFYVLKGTRQIQFYYRSHTVGNKIRTHDGTVVAEIPGLPGAIHSIPVPPGADGKRWSIGRPGPGRLRFFNIPNYVSPSPNGLMVPREVATADKLRVLK